MIGLEEEEIRTEHLSWPQRMGSPRGDNTLDLCVCVLRKLSVCRFLMCVYVFLEVCVCVCREVFLSVSRGLYLCRDFPEMCVCFLRCV